MDTFIQGLVMAFREGLEAFLIIMILLKFLEKTNNEYLKKNLWYGLYAGIAASFIFGIILKAISVSIGGMGATAKLWESIASLAAVMLIITFIVWMINHGAENMLRAKQHLIYRQKAYFGWRHLWSYVRGQKLFSFNLQGSTQPVQ
jgi:high-affinity iron transporter